MDEINISIKKITAYKFFGALCNFFSLFIKKKSGAFFVMTHDGSNYGNCGVMKAALEKKGLRTYALRRHDSDFEIYGFDPVKLFRFFILNSFRMAKSEFIFMDNAFLPLAFCKPKENVKICMLWHGTGTLKKFGLDSTMGKLRDLEKRVYSKITHLFVASNYAMKIYEGCFGLSPDKIYITGCPIDDDLFKYMRENENSELSQELSDAIREIEGDSYQNKKKPVSRAFTVLFAPTFRGAASAGKIFDELKTYFSIIKNSPIEINTLLRLHPHLKDKRLDYSMFFGDDVCTDVSNVSNLNSLLKKVDLLITDYSSICFDYSILEKPMLFYAPDLTDFSINDRGIYEDYESFVPGEVVKTPEEVANKVCELAKLYENGTESHRRNERERHFYRNAFKYRDNKSTERIMDILGL